MDAVITGASRGIGRALALALASRMQAGDRLFVMARDHERLRSLVAEAGEVAGEIVPVIADLSRESTSRAAGQALVGELRPGALLIHNAGLWPSARVLIDGVEAAYATNCLCPLALQEPLLGAEKLARVMVVSAGLIAKGHFDPLRTPTGDDFGVVSTYCTTKLAGAIAMRDVARRHPAVDFVILHPGVVRTDLGARSGVLGALARVVKRLWEPPDRCAARLVRILDRARWATTPGEALWLFEEKDQAWPEAVLRDERAVLDRIAAG